MSPESEHTPLLTQIAENPKTQFLTAYYSYTISLHDLSGRELEIAKWKWLLNDAGYKEEGIEEVK
jgi:hypothetical protein